MTNHTFDPAEEGNAKLKRGANAISTADGKEAFKKGFKEEDENTLIQIVDQDAEDFQKNGAGAPFGRGLFAGLWEKYPTDNAQSKKLRQEADDEDL